MAVFWLATFELELPELQSPQALADSAATPILAAGSRYLAIEVLVDKGPSSGDVGKTDEPRSEYAILFSTVDDPERPTELKCRVGFANGAKACSVWHDRGFPLVDAKIVSDQTGKISVFSPYFAKHPFPQAESLQYESQLFALTGVTFEQQPGGESLELHYQQALGAPDGAQPDTLITRRGVKWTPDRRDTRLLDAPPPVQLELAPTRWPSLAPLRQGELRPVSTWSGTVRLPTSQKGKESGPHLDPLKRRDIFGPPAFRFENVEVLGFRVDLSTYGRDFTEDLELLVKPLNFHVKGTTRDFRYRAATSTLLIELLRYGRMKLQSPSPPLDVKDYQSQHELVVRLLVGRIDDDTAQARGPAVYVPAIFVDNPWSKVLGRDLQGFDKRMADFCVLREDGTPARLLPDGRVSRDDAGPGDGDRMPRALGDISLVKLADETGRHEGPPLLGLRCSPLSYPDWNAFETIDLGLALAGFSVSGTRWRQSDFDQVEFRRSFARSALTDNLQGFRSIQVSPVAKSVAESGLPPAWITGTFTVDDGLRIARPSGVASFTMHAVPPPTPPSSIPSAPESWNLLCKMLGDGSRADISLPTGSWYRLSFSMDLTIDDGLSWSDPGS